MDEKIVRVTENYYQEAKEAKRDRMDQNQENWDCYHLRQDYSHKKEGQSREFLSKQAMAVEQISSFFQQGLVDVGDWFQVEYAPGVKDIKITPHEVELLLNRQLQKCEFITFVGDSVKSGLLGSLMIAKIHGKAREKMRFSVDQRLNDEGRLEQRLVKEFSEKWALNLEIVRQEDYYPDPSGKRLFEIQEIWMDYHEVKKLAEKGVYDMEACEKLRMSQVEAVEDQQKKARETGQNVAYSDYRKQVKIHECWGTLIDPDTGEVIMENATWSIANDRFVLSKPQKNPFWHGMSPFVIAPILRVPGSVWHKALMDAPTKNNIAINELYNLIFDSGMMDAHGIKQIRMDWLENPDEVSEGIYPGQTLTVNSNAPIGAKVLERVDTSSMSNEAITVFQLSNSEFNQSALTNDLRMGVLPARQVKATEVVEASNAITSVFTAVAETIEISWIEKLLDRAWMTILQNMDDLDEEEVKSLIGEQRAIELLMMTPEERFASSALGHKFLVFGVSKTLNKMKDFRKLTSLLQTIATSEILLEEFIKKYDFGNLLDEIMKALDIKVERLKIPEEERAALMLAAQAGASGGSQLGMQPNMQSNIPQASTGPDESLGSRVPRPDFPSNVG